MSLNKILVNNQDVELEKINVLDNTLMIGTSKTTIYADTASRVTKIDNKLNFTIFGYYRWDSQRFVESQGNKITDLINVEENEKIIVNISPDDNVTNTISAFDENKKIVWESCVHGNLVNYIYTVSSGIKYICFGTRSGSNYLSSAKVEFEDFTDSLSYRIIQFVNNPQTTRLQIPVNERKIGLKIAYFDGIEFIGETFCYNYSHFYEDGYWGNDNDWQTDFSLTDKEFSIDSTFNALDIRNLVKSWSFGWLKSDGSYAQTDTNKVSCFVSVSPYEKYYIIAEADAAGGPAAFVTYDSSKTIHDVILPNDGALYNGYYTIPSGVSYIRINRRRWTTTAGIWKKNPKELINIETKKTDNLANPEYIFDGYVSSNGTITRGEQYANSKCIKIPINELGVISFGNYHLDNSDTAYFSFHNSNEEVVGSGSISTNIDVIKQNISIPENAKYLYFTLRQNPSQSPSSSYAYVMCNYGASLKEYVPYKEYVEKIGGYELEDYDERIDEIEENTAICSNFTDVDDKLYYKGQPIVSETSISTIVADLPISDGTNIESGYAYIDSTSYVIKVKQ